MMRPTRGAVTTLAWMLIANSAHASERVDYDRQIKPLLAARCYSCHGALKQKGGLRADTARSLVEGGSSGPAVVPGELDESALIERVTGGGGGRMPPKSEGEGLTAAEIALLKLWVAQGATAPADEQPEPDPRDHWAFRPPVRRAVPPSAKSRLNTSDPAVNPIDAFLGAEQEKRGLRPQPAADRRLLLRRVYLDLIGLPPSVEDLTAFQNDASPDAYDKVVDRLLAGKAHGERWGRHWMDVWRYSDWWGLGDEVRNSQKHMWHWRDWIIESINEDKGYDQMVREMIAADELYPDEPARLRATGYLARTYFKFNRNTWLEDTVEHTGKAFLGLTLNCAKCHDHKYDPIRQTDYYRFRAFFEPYQLRTDQAPGQPDYEKDGIPRAFDCNLDAPTYRFERGDENRPLKDRPLSPGLPAILALGDLNIQPVHLPVEASSPGLRPFVVENQLVEAEARIGKARAALDQAKAGLVQALAGLQHEPARSPQDGSVGDRLVHDDFSANRPEIWDAISGQWTYANGRLVQSRGDETRSTLLGRFAPPADFQARVRFTLKGGEPWRSSGICFDVSDGHEVLVYLSAYAGGPKLQVSYQQGGASIFPPEGAQARKVSLDEAYELTLRIRGQLINVAINGDHALAYRIPLERRTGKMSLITYAAKAEFSAFDLSPLPTDARLVEAGGAQATVDREKANVEVAEKSLAAAEAQPEAIRTRAAADRARFARPKDDHAEELARRAARFERKVALARAEEDLARAALAVLNAGAGTVDVERKKHEAAKAAVEAARKAVEAPGLDYTPIAGARKTLESNLETPASRDKPFPTTSTGRRTALAQWLTDRRNPLTVRVAVNHIWMRHFGKPLVPTVFDFGRKGTPPTHPELLDWLADEFMNHRWSMKHLHRLIVMSEAYRRSSSSAGADRETLAADRENRWYWRMNPIRMESQVVRDSLLQLAGVLDPTTGGPPIEATNETSRRRSLYFVHSHNDHHKFLATFDDAGVQECYRRSESIVPVQALALSNSRLALSMAAQIGERLQVRLGSVSDQEFARAAFETILADAPQPAELEACEQSLADLKALLTKQGVADPSRRARNDLVQALLNHNDFLTIR